MICPICKTHELLRGRWIQRSVINADGKIIGQQCHWEPSKFYCCPIDCDKGLGFALDHHRNYYGKMPPEEVEMHKRRIFLTNMRFVYK